MPGDYHQYTGQHNACICGLTFKSAHGVIQHVHAQRRKARAEKESINHVDG